jgi:hypothetical protein
MARVRQYVSTAAVVLFGSLAFGQAALIPTDNDLAQITARGRMLYEYDQAAWHASDAVMATHPPKEDLGRYIAQKTDAGWVVAFGHLNETRDSFLVAILATQGKTPEEYSVKKLDSAQRDTGFFLAAAKAIEIALRDFRGPDRPYNAAVLPAPGSQLYVYVVPAQTENGVYPLGADVRYMVSPDGGTIVEKRQLHKGIIPSGGPVPPGATVVGGSHSHVLSNVPEDTDVFYVLTRKPSMPEYIGTQIAIYEVRPDGTIRVVERMKKHH